MRNKASEGLQCLGLAWVGNGMHDLLRGESHSFDEQQKRRVIELWHWERGLRMHRCVLHRQSIDDIGIVRYEIPGVIALRADDPADIDNAMERLAVDGAEILNALGRQNCSATRATLRCICHRCDAKRMPKTWEYSLRIDGAISSYTSIAWNTGIDLS